MKRRVRKDMRCTCRHYYSWVLAMLISQHGQLLHTFPRTMFSVKNFTVGGYSCMPDKIPIDRRISYPLASNLYKVHFPCLDITRGSRCKKCAAMFSWSSDGSWSAFTTPPRLPELVHGAHVLSIWTKTHLLQLLNGHASSHHALKFCFAGQAQQSTSRGGSGTRACSGFSVFPWQA